MTTEQFTYWLQGFVELTPDGEVPSAVQWRAIKDHLKTVFVKVTPTIPFERPNLSLKEMAEEMERRRLLTAPNPFSTPIPIQVTC